MFADPLESEVQALIAAMAVANSTGKISESRIATERRALAEIVTQHSESAVLYGIREAISHSAPDVRYVRRCAAGYRPDNPRHLAIVGQAPKRFEGENTTRKWDDESLLRGSA